MPAAQGRDRENNPRRWAALLLLGGRVAAGWLRRGPPRPLWRTLVCVGLVAALAATGPARSALTLTALAAGLHAGRGLIDTVFT